MATSSSKRMVNIGGVWVDPAVVQRRHHIASVERHLLADLAFWQGIAAWLSFGNVLDAAARGATFWAIVATVATVATVAFTVSSWRGSRRARRIVRGEA